LGIYKWQSHLPEFLAVELRQQTVTQGLCGNARLIGKKVDRTLVHPLDSPPPDLEAQGSSH
jgi:hypothetical protein